MNTDNHRFGALTRSAANLPDGFWKRYQVLLSKHNVKTSVARWHVRRVEQFLDAHRAVPVSEITPPLVDEHLDRLLGEGHLQDWQALQTIDRRITTVLRPMQVERGVAG